MRENVHLYKTHVRKSVESRLLVVATATQNVLLTVIAVQIMKSCAKQGHVQAGVLQITTVKQIANVIQIVDQAVTAARTTTASVASYKPVKTDVGVHLGNASVINTVCKMETAALTSNNSVLNKDYHRSQVVGDTILLHKCRRVLASIDA